MKLLELFSGIGGFSLGFDRAGYKFDWIGYSEIDKYANEVFERRFPDAVKLGSITDVRCEDLPEDITILSGGFPCQAFSIAGKREGFSDTRGTLFFEIARILRYFVDIEKPIPYFLLENVKGLLNHEDGRTFAAIYGVLAELGYTIECEIINTRQYLPQNRERIFFVGYFGDGSGSKVFPLGEGGGRTYEGNGSISHSNISPTIDKRVGDQTHYSPYVIDAYTEKSFDGKREDGGRAIRKHKVPGESPCLSSQMGTGGNNVPMISPTIRAEHHNTADVHFVKQDQSDNPSTDEDGNVTAIDANYFKGHGTRGNKMRALAVDDLMMRDGRDNRSCLRAGRTPEIGHKGSSIRRLTPTECARLQGFPDDWNDWQSDTQRYKQFGNAVSVPVISAIAEKMKGIVYVRG